MSVVATVKARLAANALAKGKTTEAKKLYEEAVAAGMNEPRYLLSYSVLLIRDGEYQKARELLVKHQSSPYMTGESRKQLYVNYAACVYKLGDLQKGISVLESQHAKEPSGIIYQTLGYLYVEAGDRDKALAFNQEALEYDEEDPISLDNMAQTYYRVVGDKKKAREYFEKALSFKPGQIDTLYFLAQYDIEEGKKEAAKEKLETALKGRFSPLNFATKDKVNALLATLG